MTKTDQMIMQSLWAKCQRERRLPARLIVPDDMAARMTHRQFVFQLPPELPKITDVVEGLSLADLPDISGNRLTVDIIPESQATPDDWGRVKERLEWTH